MSQSDPARKVEQNYVFACGAGAKCEAVALSAHAPNNPKQRNDVAIHKSTVLCVQGEPSANFYNIVSFPLDDRRESL
ncbi:TPA: hypothetical protein CPT80_05980 [Candidatus Gastranaerophilales bacterium HUM_9]|nr:MAG TPA: hypothetical protein CPT80_05980 [Candidatus Gastranaerophilales bacterium HUM_9]HBX34403.1 hypothetical protein [Cyanobacteria bacterium UBA11440]